MDDLVLALGAGDRVLHVGPRGRLSSHVGGGRPPRPPRPRDFLPDTANPLGPRAEAEITATHERRPGRYDHAADHHLFEVDRRPETVWQYYDETGQELVRGFRATFIPSPSRTVVAEDELLRRIAYALGYLQAILDTSPLEEVRRLRERGFVVPRPAGTLPEVLAQLPGAFGFFPGDQMPTDGGWVHRLAHAAGFAHR